MPHRIAIASCSHASLPQPLWPIISSRRPASFVWGGDAIYADVFKGLDWKSIGLRRDQDTKKWRFTFPPPSIHEDATPEIIRGWYTKQWEEQYEYKKFVEGNGTNRPLIYGTIDDHDFGQNNGDVTYRFRRESNLEFIDFLYSGIPNEYVADVCQGRVSTDGSCSANNTDGNLSTRRSDSQMKDKKKLRTKDKDPMYQRALEGKGVYGVQLFDFSRDPDESSSNHDGISWGNGYWIPEHEAMIDPDVIEDNDNPFEPSYSTSHAVAVFVLDVRSNKSPWPKKNEHSTTSKPVHQNGTKHADSPTYDFLGPQQWKWFKEALSNSQASINIIVSGLQIHPDRFPNDGNIVEEWSKFPEAQQLLYDTVLNSGVKSPLFVSGDVHMAQMLRKDCICYEEVMNNHVSPTIRPLVEVTTSGLTHSWGTTFSSQPKNHRWPRKLYTYFISPTFMTIAHYLVPWRDLVILSGAEVEKNKQNGQSGGKIGKQYELGLNFGEFEFDFGENGREGAVTARIFGKEAHQAPLLEMRWTFDQLSGNTYMPGMTASHEDFVMMMQQKSDDSQWICVPYRGIPHILTVYASNFIMFIVFCLLFFLPHVTIAAITLSLRRRWLMWRQNRKCSNGW